MNDQPEVAKLLRQLASAQREPFFDALKNVVAGLIARRLTAFDLDEVEKHYGELRPAIVVAFQGADFDEQKAANLAYRLCFRVVFALEDLLAGTDLRQVENLYQTVRGPNFRDNALLLSVSALREVPGRHRPALVHRIAIDLALALARVLAGDAGANQAHADAKNIERLALAAGAS